MSVVATAMIFPPRPPPTPPPLPPSLPLPPLLPLPLDRTPLPSTEPILVSSGVPEVTRPSVASTGRFGNPDWHALGPGITSPAPEDASTRDDDAGTLAVEMAAKKPGVVADRVNGHENLTARSDDYGWLNAESLRWLVALMTVAAVVCFCAWYRYACSGGRRMSVLQAGRAVQPRSFAWAARIGGEEREPLAMPGSSGDREQVLCTDSC